MSECTIVGDQSLNVQPEVREKPRLLVDNCNPVSAGAKVTRVAG